jgi:hypothetical protein
MAKRSSRPADQTATRHVETARLHGTTGDNYEDGLQDEPETTQPSLTDITLIPMEEELELAVQAERLDIKTRVHINKHNAYTINNIEFTLDELDKKRDITNPWASPDDLIEIYHRLPDYLVPEHYEFYFDFLKLSGIVQSRGARIKCFKPGLRIDGRPITSKTLLLTLFPLDKKDWETELLYSYLTKHASYFTAGTEVCPTTNREHIHVFVQVANVEELKWLKVIFPTLNIKNRLNNEPAARDYAIKDGHLLWEHGEFVQRPTLSTPFITRGTAGGEANKERWKRIMQLAENNEIATIKDQFPVEFFRFNVTIEKIAAQAHMRELQSKPPVPVDLLKKNFYIWGHAGTGKTWQARKMAGRLPYSKAQNKWWDGYSESVTGIVFNDISPMLGFNWQTVLDAGDIYPFFAEVKNGSCTICATAIPVIITSNYSPEEIMAGQNESRLQALKRRFTIVNVQWIYMRKMKILKWTFDPKSGFKPPKEQWWHQVASDTEDEMEFERTLGPEEDVHEEPQPDEEENPFQEIPIVDLRVELEAAIQGDETTIDEADGPASERERMEDQEFDRLMSHYYELRERLRQLNPSIVPASVPTTEDEDQSSDSPDTMPEPKPE